MPYRVDLRNAGDDALERLIELGALDVESLGDGTVAALMPDGVPPEQLATALGIVELQVSPAVGRDAGSVWVLTPRPIRVGRLRIVPQQVGAEPTDLTRLDLSLLDLKLFDAAAFGTGLHPTTVMCLEALDQALQSATPDALLDVGTGSGVLALAALTLGVPRATGIDIDDQALVVAAKNARINGLTDRLQLRHAGPDTVTGSWPLVLANVLPGALTEMAPALVRRLGHHGQLVLSGIPASAEPDVDRAYRHVGMRPAGRKERSGWVALVFQAPW